MFLSLWRGRVSQVQHLRDSGAALITQDGRFGCRSQPPRLCVPHCPRERQGIIGQATLESTPRPVPLVKVLTCEQGCGLLRMWLGGRHSFVPPTQMARRAFPVSSTGLCPRPLVLTKLYLMDESERRRLDKSEVKGCGLTIVRFGNCLT